MRKSWESLLIFPFCTNNAANIVYYKTARCLKIVSRYKHEEATQWTHLCWFAIDSTSKFHVESSRKLHLFWKANPCGNYDIDSTWIFPRGFDFQNRRNIDEFSTWSFLCRFDVKSTQLLYPLFPFYYFLTFSALRTYSKLFWYNAESL